MNMREKKLEWDIDKGKYIIKKYIMHNGEYLEAPKGIMITIKVPELKEKGKYFLSKWYAKIKRRMNLVILLNKIPYVNARMIE